MLRREPKAWAVSLVLLVAYFGLARLNRHYTYTAPPQPEVMSIPGKCGACHDTTNGYVQARDHFLNRRAALDRQAWADSILLQAKCGSCHRLPEPDRLPTERWEDAVINFMSKVTYYLGQAPTFQPIPAHQPYRQWMRQTRGQWMDVLHYYLVFSQPETRLPPDPPLSGLRFEALPLGIPPSPQVFDQIANVNVVDLDRNGQPDILVCDFRRHMVSWIQIQDGQWTERVLASMRFPGHTEAGDFNGDGHLDIVVADVGSNVPTDDRVGGVFLLTNDGQMQFDTTVLLEDVGRVADVRSGDFDQDGDIDFVVAVFGFLKEGEIGWLEQRPDGAFAYHRLSDKKGGVHVPTVDLDGDGQLDFIALISQEYEEVAAFLNRGGGRFSDTSCSKQARRPSALPGSNSSTWIGTATSTSSIPTATRSTSRPP